jgi:hypothetical protein
MQRNGSSVETNQVKVAVHVDHFMPKKPQRGVTALRRITA